jgi:voltage-gated potassium channel
MKKQVFNIIQIGDKSNKISRTFDIFIVIVIISNIAVMFMQTYDEMEAYQSVLKTIEIITTLIFCVEYVLRIWTADLLYKNEKPLKARLHFLRSYDGIIDLLTIIPAFFLTGFIVFRMLRVVRIFHLFRINAQYDSFNVITTVIYNKRNQIISSVFIIIILMLASSLCMYSAEHDAQPDIFKNAFSGIWWAVSTVLTVGYGDIYPVTVLGKIIAIIIAFLGVGVVAIPTGIISAGFVEQYTMDSNSSNKLLNIDTIGEVLITQDSKFIGQTIEDMYNNYKVTIYMIIRGSTYLLPIKDTKIEVNDIIIIQSNNIVKRRKHKEEEIK